MEKITLCCNACRECFDVELIEGLNWINRHEDFGDPLLCPVCRDADFSHAQADDYADVIEDVGC